MGQMVCPACGGVRSSDYHSCYRCHGAGFIDSGDSSSSSSSSTSSGYQPYQSTSAAVDAIKSTISNSTIAEMNALDASNRSAVNSKVFDASDLAAQGRYDEAIAECTKGIKIAESKTSRNWNQLGTLYNNRGVYYIKKGQIDKAIEDYKKAVQCGNSNAKENLTNAQQAKAKTASSSSSPSAEELNNQGAEAYNAEDYAKAVELFRKAADMGLATSQNWLASCYENGEGVPKDLSKAAFWYEKAAEQGHADAQFNLGYAYDEGQGVPHDKAQAYKWYRKAADQGHETAQNNLEAL